VTATKRLTGEDTSGAMAKHHEIEGLLFLNLFLLMSRK
jgi:hypothetical protein